MPFLRPQSFAKLPKTRYSILKPRKNTSIRCLFQTAPRRLQDPDPRAVPDVDAMQATEDQATMVVLEQKPEIPVTSPHEPDYDAPIDHGTSTFSPIPKRVMDGSEPGATTPAAVLSGAPIDLQARTVRYVGKESVIDDN